MKEKKNISIFISLLLRHKPELVGLAMDSDGWVYTQQLIHGINIHGEYTITLEQLEKIVAEDKKGRYRFNDDKSMIKACQGHSVPWVEPELEYMEPPVFLYHGTTLENWKKIQESGAISKMSRHAVHMQAYEEEAWKSAKRWKNSTPVVLRIAADELYEHGTVFGRTENGIWCAEEIPTEYIKGVLYE
jgi:putative RNA 2'-phosphotransferase